MSSYSSRGNLGGSANSKVRGYSRGSSTKGRSNNFKNDSAPPYHGNRRSNYSRNYPNNQYGYSGSNSYEGSRSYNYDNQNQLWMGDLDPIWDEEAIKKIWIAFGEKPVSVKVIKDKFGDRGASMNAGYCFVSFATQKEVSSAVLKNGLQIPGTTKTFKLNWASGSNNSSTHETNNHSYNPQSKSSSDYSLFIGDLSPEITEKALQNIFESSYPNQIKQVKIIHDPVTKTSKGFGFIKFASQSIQLKALNEMNGTMLGKRQVRLGIASGGYNEPTNADSDISQDINISQQQPAMNHMTNPHNTTVLISGLARRFTEDEIISYFLPFGNIMKFKMSYDRTECKIKYQHRSDASKAIIFMYGALINDCRLCLSWGTEIGKNVDNDKLSSKPESYSSTKVVYGTIFPYPERLDKYDEAQLKDNLAKLNDESDDMNTTLIDQRYIDYKKHRDDIINSLAF